MSSPNRTEENADKTLLKIAVRELVAHVLRSGDLSFSFSGPSRAAEAVRVHQRIQRQRPEGYLPEQSVSQDWESERFVLRIGGRIDGVFPGADPPLIEEIKTTTGDPAEAADAQNALHWGQLKVYAYLYARDRSLPAVDGRLTYVQLGTGKTREVVHRFSYPALADFFSELVGQYLDWAAAVVDFRQIRDRSLAVLAFPYPAYRAGQRRMAVACYRTIRDGGHLLVQAATGIGKTMAALFPAVKALGEGLTEKVFYLTARTTAKTAAEAAVETLAGNGLRLKSLTLTAKDKICFEPDAGCRPDACPFARGHYDRINAALRRAFETDVLTRRAVEAAAREHRVCPFELSLELSSWADLVVCDYNYAFDPRVHLRRFFAEENGDYTFCVDEAHNLVDRSREMFSAALSKQPFLDVRRQLKAALPGVFKSMGKINSWMLQAKKAGLEKMPESAEAVEWAETESPESLLPLLRNFVSAAERWLARNIEADFREPLLELYFAAGAFLRVAEQFDRRYAALYRAEGKDLRMRLFCLDPSGAMAEALNRCRAAVFFSATLAPMPYFRELFGCRDDAGLLALPSPFPKGRFGQFVCYRISTYFRDRKATAPKVAAALKALVAPKTGNYLVFFPSYAYLRQVYELFARDMPEVETLVQQPAMAEPEREAFLARFSAANDATLVGFAVMGGIFGEGIDLIGDRLCGAAVVGVGLPGISPERELIRQYYADAVGKGFEYAYQYPGINRVFQAAGRVIRSSSDRGVVLLIDTRFSSPRYRALWPLHWSPVPVGRLGALEKALDDFWRSTEEDSKFEI